MKAPLRTAFQLVLALATITVAPGAMANQCGDISPLLSQLGEHYYKLENIPKSTLENLSIKPNKLIDSLQSTKFRNGQGTRTLCFGVSTLREEVREFELESIESAHVNSFNEVVLKAYEYDTYRKVSRRGSVFIPLSRTNTFLNGENSLVVNKRHRQPISRLTNSINVLRGSHLREISITATSSHQGIEINQSIYVNGYLAEWFTWNLEG